MMFVLHGSVLWGNRTPFVSLVNKHSTAAISELCFKHLDFWLIGGRSLQGIDNDFFDKINYIYTDRLKSQEESIGEGRFTHVRHEGEL